MVVIAHIKMRFFELNFKVIFEAFNCYKRAVTNEIEVRKLFLFNRDLHSKFPSKKSWSSKE